MKFIAVSIAVFLCMGLVVVQAAPAEENNLQENELPINDDVGVWDEAIDNDMVMEEENVDPWAMEDADMPMEEAPARRKRSYPLGVYPRVGLGVGIPRKGFGLGLGGKGFGVGGIGIGIPHKGFGLGLGGKGLGLGGIGIPHKGFGLGLGGKGLGLGGIGIPRKGFVGRKGFGVGRIGLGRKGLGLGVGVVRKGFGRLPFGGRQLGGFGFGRKY